MRLPAILAADDATGDLVLGNAGWQDYALSDDQGLLPLGEMARPSLALGGLGMPGFTAYVGLLDMGQPKQGETVVVATATGAVGAVVGQMAKIKGARVVGIAGGADKCRFAVEEFGFDVCLDRRDPQLAESLAAAFRMASTFISRMSAALCSMRYCRSSTSVRACRCAG